MRLLHRGDTSLAIGLIAGTAMMFAQPFRSVLSLTEQLSRTYHVDLLSGFFVFVVASSLHFWGKYQQVVATAERKAQAELDATRRSEEWNRLVQASQGIANALNPVDLTAQLRTHLPTLLNGHPYWVAVWERDKWQWLLEPTHGADSMLDRLPAAAVGPEAVEGRFESWQLWPLRQADRLLGVLAVEATREAVAVEAPRIAALASVLSVAIKNGQLFGELETQSTTDALTGCYRRDHAVEILRNELRRTRRTRLPLAVLMMDVDDFKLVNDTWGHVTGDRLLAALGETLKKTLRATDVRCRYGGDEFMIILPGTPQAAAHDVVGKLRDAIAHLEVRESNHAVTCQVSVGLASVWPGEMEPEAIIRRADEALYENKAARAAAPARPAEAPAATASVALSQTL
jgi:diguanylate cyclase (GGDEF)-like protein